MRTDSNVVSEILCKSLVSLFFCLILGAAVYQSLVITPHYPSFQILLYGLIGSLFFFSLQINVRNSFAFLLVMFVLQTGFLTRPYGPVYLARDALFVGAVGAALYVFHIFFYRSTLQLRSLHPLVLGTMFVLSFSIATGLLELIAELPSGFSMRRFLWALQINAVNGFVVGLAIGLGILMIDNGYVTLGRIVVRRLWRSIVASFREFGERL
jgi:hypothetical protein